MIKSLRLPGLLLPLWLLGYACDSTTPSEVIDPLPPITLTYAQAETTHDEAYFLIYWALGGTLIDHFLLEEGQSATVTLPEFYRDSTVDVLRIFVNYNETDPSLFSLNVTEWRQVPWQNITFYDEPIPDEASYSPGAVIMLDISPEEAEGRDFFLDVGFSTYSLDPEAMAQGDLLFQLERVAPPFPQTERGLLSRRGPEGLAIQWLDLSDLATDTVKVSDEDWETLATQNLSYDGVTIVASNGAPYVILKENDPFTQRYSYPFLIQSSGQLFQYGIPEGVARYGMTNSMFLGASSHTHQYEGTEPPPQWPLQSVSFTGWSDAWADFRIESVTDDADVIQTIWAGTTDFQNPNVGWTINSNSQLAHIAIQREMPTEIFPLQELTNGDFELFRKLAFDYNNLTDYDDWVIQNLTDNTDISLRNYRAYVTD
ncbi:MAG TPA: hypothetical protein DCE41_01520 [Cytophagales bacterium]|nr:hypothetical protein [Cytophagales bacterium]HAA19264.1 hypothetical protein [Cytophagales bacterium]HAP59826.1 hypothetical protein [Cytophagales bacterium]